jgi:carboxyl-terminal processing protease
MIHQLSLLKKKWLFTGIVILCLAGTGFYKNLFAKNDDSYKNLETFSTVLDIIEKNYVDEVDSKLLIENAIKGMLSGLDPHSLFLLSEDLEELQIDTKGKFTGVGISITEKNGFITVISPIEGTPAYKAGIKPGDRIIKVNNEQVKDLHEAVKKIRGPKNTSVMVTILREGLSEPKEIKLIRDIIPIINVKSTFLKPGYGYVWITSFREQTTKDLEAALEKLEKPNPLKGLILDLRDNPGGLLPQALKVSDLFLEKGKIVSIKGRVKNRTEHYNAHEDKQARNYPMVVLINAGSASASEIVAGALQDNNRALILGTTSFGKGSVQSVETLEGNYGLKLTIARYYTPSGRSIQGKGIEPDIIVKKRFIGANDYKTDSELREKDLKNHLKPLPLIDKHPEFILGYHGKITQERLKSDNQVMQAMNILTGYKILSGK